MKLDASLGIPRAATCGTPAVPPAPPRLFARAKRWGDMPGLFTDEVLGAFAVQAAPGGVGDAPKERYEGLIDRVAPYEPLVAGQRDGFWRKVIRAAHAAG